MPASMRRRRLVCCAAAFLAVAACRGPSPQPATSSANRHNLLLVTVDTLRADRIGAWGYAPARTSAFDRIAREGVRFDAAASAVPLTLPSHATMLTGLLPMRHGLRLNAAGALPPSVPTLAETLQGAGYDTAAFVGAFVLDRRYGLDRGFATYDDAMDREQARARGLGAERRAANVVDAAAAWLKARGDRPFFLWVHVYDPHAPYDPPEPWRSGAKDPYDGEIAYADAQIERLLGQLDDGGRAARTVVALTADHGESLGQHGEPGHGLLLYEPTVRVPLAIRGPGLAPRVVTTPVGLVDLAPTLAGLVGAAMPAGVDGRDLARALRAGREPAPQDLYAETEYPRTFGWSGLAAVRRGALKYIGAPRPELYDLAADPAEATNILPSHAAGPQMERILAAARALPAVAAVPVKADDASRERMAALGYAAGPAVTAARGSGRDPKDAMALYRRFEEANEAMLAGRGAEAAAELEVLVREDPGNPMFGSLLGRAYRAKGDREAAIALYRRMLAQDPEDVERRYDLGLTLQQAGRVDEALRELAEVLRRDPQRADAHNATAIALMFAGRAEDALASFRTVVELDPRDATAHTNLANALRVMGRFEEAVAAYRRSAELAPSYGDPLNGLATIALQQRRPAEALPLLDKALALDPQLHLARLNRGLALEMLGRHADAAAAYRDFLSATASVPGYEAQRNTASMLAQRLAARR